MISRDDINTFEAIESILKAHKNDNIKITFSIKQNIYTKIKNKINNKADKIRIITYKNNYDSTFDHVNYLVSECKSDYIILLHDDDNIGKNFLKNTYEILLNYKPDALSTRAIYIDDKSKILTRRNVKSINKIYKLKREDILNKFFLPFKNDTTLLFPSIAFKTIKYKKYFSKKRFFNRLHEDVKILYYFSLGGNFCENGVADNFFFRVHSGQQSAAKISSDRIELIKWLESLNLNNFYKAFLTCFARIQYMIYFKKINFKNQKLNEFFNLIRKNFIKYRSGY